MKIFKKNSVVYLMTMSQLLLTLFVIYWLIGQFNAEEHSLRRDLNRGFMTSERIMIDSLLAKHLIDPILKDSSNSRIKITYSMDSISNDSSVRNKIFFRPFDTGVHLGSVEIMDLRQLDSLQKAKPLFTHLHASTDTSQSLLYQGVGMFVRRIEGMGFGRDTRSSFFSSRADTSVLQKSFANYLAQNEFDFSLQWISGKDNIKASSKGLSIRSRVFDRSYAANIKDYQTHLITSIIPQILFAFVLLLITLLSFRISYLNIKKQKRLLTIKNEFISNITHELKTPVATVKVALEALLDYDKKKDPKVVQEYLEMSLLEMDRLELLVSKVLSNSVMENGVDQFSPEQVDLKLLIDDVLKSQQHRLEKGGASLNFKTELSEAKTMIDKVHFQGVLINLIDNSLKYAGDQVQIELDLSHREKNYKISIKDNGPGIPNEYLDKVFDKFFRVPTNDIHNVKGYGLGLNYAKLVVDHHDGSITVRNLSDGGCEFIIIIPIIE